MEEERKAVITVSEDKDTIDVLIDFFPSADGAGICGGLAWIGFQAIVQANAKLCAEDKNE